VEQRAQSLINAVASSKAGREISILAAKIREAYRLEQHREEAFPEIAERALRESSLLSELSTSEIYTWAVGLPELPPQLDNGSTFGEPPLTVYWGERFVIDVYTWFSSTTSIHQHGFTGAFGVLEGGSVHTTYHFEEHDRVNSRLQLGQLTMKDVKFLGRGDVHAIHARRGFIHSLFHLEHPSVSVVVRTQRDDEYNPQYSYLHPGVSYDPFFADRIGRRRNEVLRALARVAPSEYAAVVRQRLEESDVASAFFSLLDAHWALLDHKDKFDDLKGRAVEVHGPRLSAFLPAIDRQLRDRHLIQLRKKIKEPDLRLFIALLLNVPTGDRIRRLLGERFPDMPAGRKVAELTSGLLDRAKLGFQLDPLQREVFELALANMPFEQMVEEIKRTYDDADVERARPSLTRFLADIARQPVIAPLFA